MSRWRTTNNKNHVPRPIREACPMGTSYALRTTHYVVPQLTKHFIFQG